MTDTDDERTVGEAVDRLDYQARNTKAEYFCLTRREVEALVRVYDANREAL